MNLPQLTAGGSLRPVTGGIRALGLANELRAGLAMAAIGEDAAHSGIIPYCSCNSAPDAPPGADAQAAQAQAVDVYVAGGIAAKFPSLSLEKEFLQTLDESDLGKNIDSLVARYLKRADNLYIAREMTWLLQQGNTEVYVLHPQSTYELQNLVALLYDPMLSERSSVVWAAIRGKGGAPIPDDGRIGGGLPVLTSKEVYIASSQNYVNAIADITNGTPDQIWTIFSQVFGFAFNAGNTDSQRAINYVVLQYISAYAQVYWLRYPEVMAPAAPGSQTEPRDSYALTGIRTASSAVQGKDTILDVIFTFSGQTSGLLQQWYCSVNVSGEFPFINTPFQRYYGIG